MTLVEKIHARLAEAGHPLPFPADQYKIERCYPSAAALEGGAWRWVLVHKPNDVTSIGSSHRASECAAGPIEVYEQHWGDTDIVPSAPKSG